MLRCVGPAFRDAFDAEAEPPRRGRGTDPVDLGQLREGARFRVRRREARLLQLPARDELAELREHLRAAARVGGAEPVHGRGGVDGEVQAPDEARQRRVGLCAYAGTTPQFLNPNCRVPF